MLPVSGNTVDQDVGPTATVRRTHTMGMLGECAAADGHWSMSAENCDTDLEGCASGKTSVPGVEPSCTPGHSANTSRCAEPVQP